jgi:sugar phosphate isomerase/epimerase
MLHSGLVSVTFRALSAGQIVDLVAQAGLEGIEWGGDVHVPHGDLSRAHDIGNMTRRAGLRVASYGSYYRVGHEEPVQFEVVLETAIALQAPLIRVWAGKRASMEADPTYRGHVVAESRRIAQLAGAAGLDVAFEYHRGTLTDTGASARRLLEEASHPRLGTYWQPPVAGAVVEHLKELALILPWLRNVHVFHWAEDTGDRLPLLEGAEAWRTCLDPIRDSGRDHWLMLEFVRGDSAQVFLQDSRALLAWMAEQHTQPGA